MSDKPQYECKFVVYAPSHSGQGDIHVVKEIVHHPDGSKTPNLRFIKDFQRTFGVTKPGFQKHSVKKESEALDRLQFFKSSQSGLQRAVKAALKKPWSNERMGDLQNSPYLYGTDIDSTALVKQAYTRKYPDVVPTPYSLAVYDTESDMLNGTKETIVSTLSMKTKVVTAVRKSFVEGQANVIERLQVLAQKYLGDVIKARGIEIEFKICDTELETCMWTMKHAHEWSPDFVTGWNLLYDVQQLEAACTRASVDIRDYMSDPKVPKDYRAWKVTEGPASRETASGVWMSYQPAQRWHKFYNTASFYLIDAMSSYYYIRQGEQAESSYSLDNILKLKLKRGKLKFEEADKYAKAEWHVYMQRNHPLEYVIYNIFDCVGIEMLDEKTKDLSVMLPLYSEYSDFARFKSQPRRKVDSLHFFYLDRGRMIGCTGSQMLEPGDEDVISADGHVITLHAGRLANNGLCCILEDPHMRTNIRIANADNDVTGAYPTNQVVMNVSKATTVCELIKIEGIEEQDKRNLTMNFPAGHTNAVDFCTTVLNLPTLHNLLTQFQQDMAEQ